MLYRVSYDTFGASYSTCFTDKKEAEEFYSRILQVGCYKNVALQIG